MPTTVYDLIGQAEALGAYVEAQVIGKQIKLSHRGGSDVTLDCNILGQGIGKLEIGGRLMETGTLDFEIPVQPGFAVMSTNARPITEGDRVEFPVGSGRYFFVEASTDIEQASNGYRYKVRAYERKTFNFGARS